MKNTNIVLNSEKKIQNEMYIVDFFTTKTYKSAKSKINATFKQNITVEDKQKYPVLIILYIKRKREIFCSRHHITIYT
jgi:hypothetical protein